MEIKEFIEQLYKKYPREFKTEFNWYGVTPDTRHILELGIDAYIDELYDYNLDYMFELEDSLIDYILETYELEELYPDADFDDVKDTLRSMVTVDLNIEELLRRSQPVLMRVNFYNDYDCCNSMSEIATDEYHQDVLRLVKPAINMEDYEYEAAHVYGGSIFCFAVEMSLEEALDLKKAIQEGATELEILSGTHYGFHSSLVGSSTPFESTTKSNLVIPLKEVDVSPDCLDSYNIQDVYGRIDFIKGGWITCS